jgi:MFS family permease
MSVALLMLGNGVFSTFLALRASAEGFSNDVIGWIASSYYIGLILGTFKCGALVNRIGHIRAFAAFSAISAAGILSFGLFVSPSAWIALRIVLGFNLAGLYMVAESWLNTKATSETRGTILSIYMTITYLALGGGQFLINVADIEGDSLFMISAILLTLALVPVSITRASHPDPVESSHMSVRALFAISPVAAVGCVVSGIVVGSMFGMGPIYAKEQGLDTQGISLFMGIVIIAGLFTQVPVGQLSDRFDRRGVIVAVTVATALVGLALIFIASLQIVSLYVWIALYGGLTATLYPLCVAYANDYLEPGQVVAASGSLVFAFGIGAAAGPPVAAFIMGNMGSRGLFVLSFCVCVLYIGFIMHRMRIRSWAPVVDKDPYVPMPEVIAAPVISELDPRAEVDEQYDLTDGYDRPSTPSGH